ncbi:hypothetical protein HK102_010563 [Quaeritorhiza haematococci]|nr:hypothetical protein HK102_010563 [Quaeritorhiza haematococci]
MANRSSAGLDVILVGKRLDAPVSYSPTFMEIDDSEEACESESKQNLPQTLSIEVRLNDSVEEMDAVVVERVPTPAQAQNDPSKTPKQEEDTIQTSFQSMDEVDHVLAKYSTLLTSRARTIYGLHMLLSGDDQDGDGEDDDEVQPPLGPSVEKTEPDSTLPETPQIPSAVETTAPEPMLDQSVKSSGPRKSIMKRRSVVKADKEMAPSTHPLLPERIESGQKENDRRADVRKDHGTKKDVTAGGNVAGERKKSKQMETKAAVEQRKVEKALKKAASKLHQSETQLMVSKFVDEQKERHTAEETQRISRAQTPVMKDAVISDQKTKALTLDEEIRNQTAKVMFRSVEEQMVITSMKAIMQNRKRKAVESINMPGKQNKRNILDGEIRKTSEQDLPKKIQEAEDPFPFKKYYFPDPILASALAEEEQEASQADPSSTIPMTFSSSATQQIHVHDPPEHHIRIGCEFEPVKKLVSTPDADPSTEHCNVDEEKVTQLKIHGHSIPLEPLGLASGSVALGMGWTPAPPRLSLPLKFYRHLQSIPPTPLPPADMNLDEDDEDDRDSDSELNYREMLESAQSSLESASSTHRPSTGLKAGGADVALDTLYAPTLRKPDQISTQSGSVLPINVEEEDDEDEPDHLLEGTPAEANNSIRGAETNGDPERDHTNMSQTSQPADSVPQPLLEQINSGQSHSSELATVEERTTGQDGQKSSEPGQVLSSLQDRETPATVATGETRPSTASTLRFREGSGSSRKVVSARYRPSIRRGSELIRQSRHGSSKSRHGSGRMTPGKKSISYGSKPDMDSEKSRSRSNSRGSSRSQSRSQSHSLSPDRSRSPSRFLTPNDRQPPESPADFYARKRRVSLAMSLASVGSMTSTHMYEDNNHDSTDSLEESDWSLPVGDNIPPIAEIDEQSSRTFHHHLRLTSSTKPAPDSGAKTADELPKFSLFGIAENLQLQSNTQSSPRKVILPEDGPQFYESIHSLEKRKTTLNAADMKRYPAFNDPDSFRDDKDSEGLEPDEQIQKLSDLLSMSSVPIPTYLRRRAILYGRVGKFEQALADLNMAIKYGS